MTCRHITLSSHICIQNYLIGILLSTMIISTMIFRTIVISTMITRVWRVSALGIHVDRDWCILIPRARFEDCCLGLRCHLLRRSILLSHVKLYTTVAVLRQFRELLLIMLIISWYSLPLLVTMDSVSLVVEPMYLQSAMFLFWICSASL